MSVAETCDLVYLSSPQWPCGGHPLLTVHRDGTNQSDARLAASFAAHSVHARPRARARAPASPCLALVCELVVARAR
eukprot:4664137-Pleurochrysis_carterae.AAC.1